MGTMIFAFIGLGILLIAAGLWRITAQRTARERWVRVDGVFEGASVGIENAATSIVRFRTREGREIVGSPRISTDVGIYPEGRTIPVWYDPENPERFETEVQASDRLFGPLLVTAGLLPLAYGLSRLL